MTESAYPSMGDASTVGNSTSEVMDVDADVPEEEMATVAVATMQLSEDVLRSLDIKTANGGLFILSSFPFVEIDQPYYFR